MGRLDLTLLRYLERSDFRLLTAVEMGMKNHELVPAHLVVQISRVKGVGVHKRLRDLAEHKLLAYERGGSYDGYRLTNLGYDYLALRVLANRDALTSVGNQIGVGKEADIYLATNAEEEALVIKLHRLGRTSFRRVKEKRNYHQKRQSCSWIYLSRLSALKEFAFIKALHAHDFPVPRPVDCSRHCIVMSKVNGHPLNQVSAVNDPAALYGSLMDLILRLASFGLIHGDFNEFNLMIDVDTEKAIMIDFPQMVSTSHENAEDYFDRDVRCIRQFFKRRFDFEAELAPSFADIEKNKSNLDAEVSASGFTKEMRKKWKTLVEDDGEEGGDADDDDVELNSLASDSDEEEEEDGKGDEEEEEFVPVKDRPHRPRPPVDHLTAWMNKLKPVDAPEGGPEEEDAPQLITQSSTSAADVDHFDSVSQRGVRPGAASTVCSTIAPDEVRRRVRTQACHGGGRQRVKVKGDANAVRRGRKTNANVVEDYAGWDLN